MRGNRGKERNTNKGDGDARGKGTALDEGIPGLPSSPVLPASQPIDTHLIIGSLPSDISWEQGSYRKGGELGGNFSQVAVLGGY